MSIKNIFKKILNPITLGIFRFPLSNKIFNYLNNQKMRQDRRVLEKQLINKDLLGNVVQFGPFNEMEYPEGWASCKFQKIIGSYEAELHHILEDIKNKKNSYTSLINIGAAEGYFAIGIGRQTSDIPIICYETQQTCQDFLLDLARLNEVAERVSIHGECTLNNLKKLETGTYPLVVCDVEGAEIDLLMIDQTPWLKNADILVELHDYFISGISHKIRERFQETHQIELITSQGLTYKNYPILNHLTFKEIKLMVNEDRPNLQNWYFMTPKKTELK